MNSKPSGLNQPRGPGPSAEGKRPGSDKRSKTAELPIHEEIPLPPKDLPPGSTLLQRDAFVVQDLVIQVHNTRYLVEVWQTPTGERLRGELPAGIRGHFGPGLIGFVLQQHYEAHVPQSRILEELAITASTFRRVRSPSARSPRTRPGPRQPRSMRRSASSSGGDCRFLLRLPWRTSSPLAERFP